MDPQIEIKPQDDWGRAVNEVNPWQRFRFLRLTPHRSNLMLRSWLVLKRNIRFCGFRLLTNTHTIDIYRYTIMYFFLLVAVRHYLLDRCIFLHAYNGSQVLNRIQLGNIEFRFSCESPHFPSLKSVRVNSFFVTDSTGIAIIRVTPIDVIEE